MYRWLHDLGYRFVGPTSIYDLTLYEVDRLLHGAYEEHIKQAGVRPSDLDKLGRYASAKNLKVS